jgi:hypothetical protein
MDSLSIHTPSSPSLVERVCKATFRRSLLLDTLPVCRDFKQGHCERQNCRYVHLLEDYVEVHEGKVTVCRDFAKGKCTRVMCKYYHVPLGQASAPAASLLLAGAGRLHHPQYSPGDAALLQQLAAVGHFAPSPMTIVSSSAPITASVCNV